MSECHGRTPEGNENKTTLAEMTAWVDQFSSDRDWGKYHSPKNLAISISIEASELLEHFQWTDGGRWREGESTLNREAAAAEMADILAYLLRLGSVLKIDLGKALAQKMAENAKKYPA
ncbi:nucleotide pyrophosphohydrolase [Pirellulaceae bacterium SH449]